MKDIVERGIYLERMEKPLQEKLRVVKFFPEHAEDILDVGCANGAVTIEMAKLFPHIQFKGIDLDGEFIEEAKKRAMGIPNISFEQVYLRELLARKKRYDTVTFISVLHEFFTYGEGISSVMKAMADAHEILRRKRVSSTLLPKPVTALHGYEPTLESQTLRAGAKIENPRIIIRDMILNDYTKTATLHNAEVVEKIKAKNFEPQLNDTERRFGKLHSIYRTNHFLLKYMYKENWDREGKEHYVPVTFEQYLQMFDLLGMKVEHTESFLIDYLRNKWQEDFGLTKDETNLFKSTGIIVAEKVKAKH